MYVSKQETNIKSNQVWKLAKWRFVNVYTPWNTPLLSCFTYSYNLKWCEETDIPDEKLQFEFRPEKLLLWLKFSQTFSIYRGWFSMNTPLFQRKGACSWFMCLSVLLTTFHSTERFSWNFSRNCPLPSQCQLHTATWPASQSQSDSS